MSASKAPRPEHEPYECTECESELIIDDGDKVCKSCGLLGGSVPIEKEPKTEWDRWTQHRDEKYSGFYGMGRIKMVGGFEGAYFDDDGKLSLFAE